MAADTPENYARYPGPLQFIRDVPTDWSDTRVLAGEVGDYATIVRKDRKSDDWYLGSVTDEDARTLSISLSFLDPGRTYRAISEGRRVGKAGVRKCRSRWSPQH